MTAARVFAALARSESGERAVASALAEVFPWARHLTAAERRDFAEELIAAVVVLALFVPLCISTGGNSGTQAATLVTRAMALGYAYRGELARAPQKVWLAFGTGYPIATAEHEVVVPQDARGAFVTTYEKVSR